MTEKERTEKLKLLAEILTEAGVPCTPDRFMDDCIEKCDAVEICHVTDCWLKILQKLTKNS